MRKFLKATAGVTLIELVLAIAITSLIASITSTLIGYAVWMRRRSDAQSEMYLASIRLHKAITTELAAAGQVSLYSTGPTTYGSVASNERVMRLADGEIKWYNSAYTSGTALLPTGSGFNSYNRNEDGDGVVVEDLSFRLVKLVDYLGMETTTADTLYRAVEVTTKVSKSGFTYEHTSTIRFDEMYLYSAQVKVSKTTYNYNTANLRAAQTSDDNTVFKLIRYSTD